MVFIVAVAGCNQVSHEMHPWQSRGDVFSVEIDTRQWTVIEPRRVGRVGDEHMAEACTLLAEAEAVEVSADQVRSMCPEAKIDLDGALKPFLVRSVAYSPTASGVARINEASGWLYVFRATWNGEMYFPGLRWTPEAAPIVVLLENKPSRVLCVANVGGDGITRGMKPEEVW